VAWVGSWIGQLPSRTASPPNTSQHPSSSATHPNNHHPQMFYFPDSEGFRFRGGGNGVYFAAKDLHVAEISAAISVSLQRAPGKSGPVARLTVSLTGASTGGDAGCQAGQTGGSVGAAVTAAEAARAAAAQRAENAREAALRAAKQQQRQQGGAPGRPGASDGGRSPFSGSGGSGWQDGFSGVGSPRKGRGVAKFLDNLSTRKEQLKEKISAAAASAGSGCVCFLGGFMRALLCCGRCGCWLDS